MNRTLDDLTARIRPVEWAIYPTGTGTYACGSPDGDELRDRQRLEILLGGHWIAGCIEQPAYHAPRFVALDDHRSCGLCPGMHIRLPAWREG